MTYHGGSSGDRSDRDAAKDAAADVAQAGRAKAWSFLDEQRVSAADGIHGMADALRKTAHSLDGEHRTTSRLTRSAADGVESFAEVLREKDPETLLREAEGFARRSPAIFLGGAVTAGFLLGRFLKSSRDRAPEEHELAPAPARSAREPFGAMRPSSDTHAQERNT